MKAIVSDQVILSRAPEGPLVAHIGSFAKALSAQGYTLSSIRRQVRLGACFSEWLKSKRVALHSITAGHSVKYLRHRGRQIRPCAGDAAALGHLIDFLNREGLIPTRRIPASALTPAQRCVQAYERYLREERALSNATIINYIPFICDFLKERFGDRYVKLSLLTACDVVRFAQRQASRSSLSEAKNMTTAMRSFLRYARYRGEVTLDLAAAVPVVANWSMTSIPRAIAPDQVRQLLASIDRRTAIGRRDYAVLLLLARLGLRSGEVVSIELDDIDWTAGHLSVRGKREQRSNLPLSSEIGKAIAAYLQRGRPRSTSRRLFLRAKAPIRGFRGPCGVGSIVRSSLMRAGIDAPTRGAHQFRHGLATDMLRQGAKLSEIGDVLGHRHAQITKIYAHVDIKALRALALPWPGGGQ